MMKFLLTNSLATPAYHEIQSGVADAATDLRSLAFPSRPRRGRYGFVAKVGNVEIGWTPYPWHALEKVPRSVMRAIRDVTAALHDPTLARRLAPAASRLLGEDKIALLPRSTRVAASTVPVFRDGIVCLLANQEHTVLALLEVEPELAHRVASALLSRPPLWVDRAQPTPPLLHAAFGAFVMAAVRAASPQHDLHLDAVGPRARETFTERSPTVSPVVDLAVVFDEASFGASVWWHGALTPTRGIQVFDERALRDLGSVPLGLQVVAAISTSTRAELSSLELGDAFMPGQGWLVRLEQGELAGDVMLLSPFGTLGLSGWLRTGGEIVLGGSGMQAQDRSEQRGTPDPGSSKARPGTTPEALSEVPVEVRVEVGTVALSAREWAAVQPGDVLTTGRRIAERVTLRVGGVAVARGELVDVEGELGVRIHALSGPNGSAIDEGGA